MKIFLWGCGERSKYFIENKYFKLDEIVGFIDNNKEIKEFFGKKVYEPKEGALLLEEVNYILVTIRDYEVNKSIYEQMKNLNVPLEKVLFIYNYRRSVENIQIHNQNDEVAKEISERLYNNVLEIEKRVVLEKNDMMTCGFDTVDDKKIIGSGILKEDNMYLRDYMRFRTFELVADEINNKSLPGAAAEVGVFRGDFAKLINAKFQDRKLYLFDSFESFRPEEYEKERQAGNCQSGFKKVFANTSVEIAMENMKYPENCIIRKGFFPESIIEKDKEEKFAFVSMDVDFEESMYQCLKFFYPRLVENGYIFMHDYNNRSLRGVKIAVDRYEKDFNVTLKKVPISDQGGTLIIVK